MKKTSLFLCICLFFSVIYVEGQAPRGQSFNDEAILRMERAFAQQEATPVDAYYLGRAIAANILASYKPYTGNPQLTRYVNQICQTIVINSAYPDLFNGYHVMILDSPEFNAFATPGGHIFLTRGLVQSTTSEDTLAAVIAHELAHIMLKHSLTLIDNIKLYDDMQAMVDMAVRFSGNTETAVRYSYYRNSVAATIDAMVKNGYSQDQEFEADEGAVVLLAASGYSPEALLEILTMLQRIQGSQRGGFNTTHPSPAQRIENAQKYVSHYRVRDTRSFRELRFRNR